MSASDEVDETSLTGPYDDSEVTSLGSILFYCISSPLVITGKEAERTVP